jgi:peptide/nickel transport system permease protein
VGKLVVRRLALAPLLLAIVTFLIFLMTSLAPGDPAMLAAGDNPALASVIRKQNHLNDPVYEQYARWVERAVQGNFGRSYIVGDASVVGSIRQRAPITLSIAGVAILMSLTIAVILGTIAALFPDKLIDRVITSICSLFIAVPAFWLGYLLVLWFAVKLQWLPSIGYVPLSVGFWPWLSHIILPAFCLALLPAATKALQLRGSLLEVFSRDYILSARAKGLSSWSVTVKHGLKNALAPVVTLLGFQLAAILGGSVIVERVFSIPGMGSLAVQSTVSEDTPMLLGIVTFTTIVVILANTIVDLLYGYLNPRVRTA